MRREKYIIMFDGGKLSGWHRLDWAEQALYFYISQGLKTPEIVTIH